MYILVSLLEYGSVSGITQTKNIKIFVNHHAGGLDIASAGGWSLWRLFVLNLP